MMTATERILGALRTAGCAVQVRDGSRIRAHCPAHRDVRPSLAITHRDGRLLIKCFAGCRTSVVVHALGLRMADLFDGPQSSMRQSTIVANYDYCDDEGNVIAQKVRFSPKAFRWRVPSMSTTGWHWGLNGQKPGLYRVHDLVERRQVLVVEGEKAVDALSSVGVVATCGAAGASLWSATWTDVLWRAGCAEVVVVPDNDRTGSRHAERVAHACYNFVGITDDTTVDTPWTAWPSATVEDPEVAPLRVKIVHLPLPPSGDVVDWLEAGHDVVDLAFLIETTPSWSPDAAERARVERRRRLTVERVRRHRDRARAEQQADNHLRRINSRYTLFI